MKWIPTQASDACESSSVVLCSTGVNSAVSAIDAPSVIVASRSARTSKGSVFLAKEDIPNDCEGVQDLTDLTTLLVSKHIIHPWSSMPQERSAERSEWENVVSERGEAHRTRRRTLRRIQRRTERQRKTHRERQRDRETDRETDRGRERQRETERETERYRWHEDIL